MFLQRESEREFRLLSQFVVEASSNFSRMFAVPLEFNPCSTFDLVVDVKPYVNELSHKTHLIM